LDKKEEPVIFVGYSLISKAYKIDLLHNNKVTFSRDAKFLEFDCWSWKGNNELELQKENEDVDDKPVRGTRLLSDIYQRCNVVVMEPIGYEEAINDKKWINAMKEKLKMIEKDHTGELVDKPNHKKSIRVKWIYRTKFNLDCSVNKYKARLVVKAYTHILG